MQKPLPKQAKHKLFFPPLKVIRVQTSHLRGSTTLESPVELINLDTSPYTIKYKSLGTEPGIGSR